MSTNNKSHIEKITLKSNNLSLIEITLENDFHNLVRNMMNAIQNENLELMSELGQLYSKLIEERINKMYERFLISDIDRYLRIDDIKIPYQRKIKQLSESIRLQINRIFTKYLHTYLFCNSIKKILSLSDLISNHDYKIPNYIQNNVLPLGFISELNKLTEMYLSYNILNRKGKKIFREHGSLHNKIIFEQKCNLPDFDKKNFSKTNAIPTSGERQVICALEKIEINNNFHYYYKFRPMNCKYIGQLEFDFFCVKIHNDRIYLFVIEFDGSQHRKEIKYFKDYTENHIRDIMKQYYLYQMNIHLLRLEKTNNIYIEINQFIKSIIKTNKCLVINPIVPEKEKFNNESINFGLKHYYDYYSVNQNNHFKTVNGVVEIDDDDFDSSGE